MAIIAAFQFVPLVAALLVAGFAASPAHARSEHCMLDGDDVMSTFFAAPTTDTTPVRIVMKGRIYVIPRNYFSYPKKECRTGESRGFTLRMTLPDLRPATAETWDSLYGESAGRDDNYVVVAVSQVTISLRRIMEAKLIWELEGRSAPPIEGLDSFLMGPLIRNGDHDWDLYYEGPKASPHLIIPCSPIRPKRDPGCKFMFEHNDLTWGPRAKRNHLDGWRSLVGSIRTKIDSFIVTSGGK